MTVKKELELTKKKLEFMEELVDSIFTWNLDDGKRIEWDRYTGDMNPAYSIHIKDFKFYEDLVAVLSCIRNSEKFYVNIDSEYKKLGIKEIQHSSQLTLEISRKD